MLYVFAVVSAASALLCLLAMLLSSATLLGKVLLGLIFCGAVGALIASVEKIISLRRDEREEPAAADFEKPVSIQQAPFAGNAFSNDYKPNTAVVQTTVAPVAAVTSENPWKFVPEYRPIPPNAPPFPAPIQNPAPHSTPYTYVPQQPVQTVTPSGNDGISAALGGLALGTLLGATMGSSAATAQAAAVDEERRRRNNQTVTSPSPTSSEPVYVPPAALAPITAAEAEAQASGEAPKGVEDFEVVANEPAAGVALAPITADEAEDQSHAEPQIEQPEEHEPTQFHTLEEPQNEQPGVALEPITADEAEHTAPSYSEPEPAPEPEPTYLAPAYVPPMDFSPEPTRYEPEPRYEAPSYTRDPDPEPSVPDTSWSDTASSTWDSGSSWSD